jgi:UDP-2,3-diacylglucosamine hydrolase
MDHAPASLPQCWEYCIPAGWRSIEFISDLHLSEKSPQTTAALRRYLDETSADGVFILGDFFEVWVGDDARHEGFGAEMASLLKRAASRRAVGFMVGNRDFLVGGDFISHCGLIALPDPTVLIGFGQRLLISHGDALCVADLPYQEFRAQVRSATWQQAFLAKPLAERVEIAQRIRQQSQHRRTHSDPMSEADVDGATAVRWLHEAGCATLIHGHTHRPGVDPLARGFVRQVLSDWDLDDLDSGLPRAQVLRWDIQGPHRIQLTQ